MGYFLAIILVLIIITGIVNLIVTFFVWRKNSRDIQSLIDMYTKKIQERENVRNKIG